jgi:hypothetical protein
MSKINKIQNPINQQRPVLDTVTQKVIDAGVNHDLYQPSVSVDSRALRILCFEFVKIVKQRSCVNVIT